MLSQIRNLRRFKTGNRKACAGIGCVKRLSLGPDELCNACNITANRTKPEEVKDTQTCQRDAWGRNSWTSSAFYLSCCVFHTSELVQARKAEYSPECHQLQLCRAAGYCYQRGQPNQLPEPDDVCIIRGCWSALEEGATECRQCASRLAETIVKIRSSLHEENDHMEIDEDTEHDPV